MWAGAMEIDTDAEDEAKFEHIDDWVGVNPTSLKSSWLWLWQLVQLLTSED